ncbi:MAG: transcriptional regulator [Methylothermaceae bacteria B42]|nr:MAG: transcriptional regulator [Methylothermaceae bacteria B42]HHJ39456.1 zinc ribbon domain-containing protein [Methylothermaceae bacterium]
MPIYEYQCQSCGHELEALQKISDPPLTECPKCHHEALQKKVSAAGFRLKGSGWYETDFKKSNEKKRNLAGDSKGSSKSTSEKSSKSSTSTEKKTATG